MSVNPSREPIYETFAAEFEAHAEDGFYNAYVDRPACLELLGDVAGQRILDAACGPGLYAEELVRRGAQVVGFDHSPAMVRLSQDRAPAGEFRVHDGAEPLNWLEDNSFDAVLFALALEYIDDRVALLRELHRVLKPWGRLVLSRMHPTGDWLRQGGNYFEPRVISEIWRGSWPMRYWVNPMETTAEELYAAGFLIERLWEPRPVSAAQAINPARYEQLTRKPMGFLAIRALART